MQARAIIGALVVTTLVLVTFDVTPDAQSPNPATSRRVFEVASIKPHAAGIDGELQVSRAVQPGRFVATNVSVVSLIVTAFRKPGASALRSSQVLNGPGWLTTARFDIAATADLTREAMNAQLPDLMRSLLEDRFKLATHRETRTADR